MNFPKTTFIIILLACLLSGAAFAAVPVPQMEMLFEDNIVSTGSVAVSGWWYTNEFISGVDGTVGAGLSDTSNCVAFGGANGGTEMVDALSNGLESFTITAWIKADTLEGFYDNGTVFANTTVPNSSGIHLYAGSTYPGAMLLRVNGENKWGPSSLPYDVVGDWQFIAITYDGTTSTDNVVWYWAENGVLQSWTTSMTSGSVTATDTSPIVIGGGNASAILRLHGGVDEFRMWGSQSDSSAVLTATEIEEVMAAHTTVNPGGPVSTPESPQLELLMENNITSSGTVVQDGWWYTNEFIAGVDGTVGAGFSDTSNAIAFGPTTGGTAMNEALSSGLDSFTITAWIKANSMEEFFDNGTLFANTTAPNESGIHLYAGAGHPGAMLLRINGEYQWGPGSLPYDVVGDWQFIAVTYDGTKSAGNCVWYWLEGGLLQSWMTDMTSGPVLDSSTAPIVIGGGNANSISRLHGGVDDFRMWASKTDNSAVLDPNEIRGVINEHTTLGTPVEYKCDLEDLNKMIGDWLADTIIWDNDMTVDPNGNGWVQRSGIEGDYIISEGKMVINGNTGNWRLDTTPQNGFPGRTIISTSMRATTTSNTSEGSRSGIGMWMNVDTRTGSGDYGALNFHVVLKPDNTQYVEFIEQWDPSGWPPTSYVRVEGDGITDFDSSMLDIDIVMDPNSVGMGVDYTIADQAGTTANGQFFMNRRAGSAAGFEAATLLTGGAEGEVDDIYIEGPYTPQYDVAGNDGIVDLKDFAWFAEKWLLDLTKPCWTQ